jgi:flagellin-specific chaperone FliS
MISAWTKHLKEEDRERFNKTVQAAKPVLQRLQQLLDEEKSGLETAEISSKIYDSPNWDYKQAHTNGFKSALKMVSKIINLDQKE